MTITQNRVPQGIPSGGQFAHKTHGEGGVSLGTGDGQSGTGLPLEDLAERAIASYGEGMRPHFEHELSMLENDEARELYRRSLDGRYNTDTGYTFGQAGYGSTNADVANRMVGLGVEDPGKYTTQASKVFGWTSTALDSGITQERMDVLEQLGTNVNQWSRWEKEAYLGADVDRLSTVADIPASDRLGRYTATLALLGHRYTARLEEAKKHGLGDKGLIEHDHHSVEKLAALKALLPKSKQNAYEIGKLADAEVTPELLKTYGAKVCDTFPVLDLKNSPMPPAVLKSLHNGHPHAQFGELIKLHEGGFTKGGDLKVLTQTLADLSTKNLIAVRKVADPQQVATWALAVRRNITLDDAKAIGELDKHGYGDPQKLKEFTPGLHTAANELMDREQSVIPVWASIVKAGITPEKLKTMTRAGIPVDRAAEYADTSDLWAAGAPFREKIAANRQRRIDTGWTRNKTVDPWVYTEANYREG